MVSFSKAIGITETVNYAAEIERIEAVSMDAKVVNKADCFIYIVINCTELVDSSCPVRPVGNTFFKPFFITCGTLCEEESKT